MKLFNFNSKTYYNLQNNKYIFLSYKLFHVKLMIRFLFFILTDKMYNILFIK